MNEKQIDFKEIVKKFQTLYFEFEERYRSLKITVEYHALMNKVSLVIIAK